MLKIRTFIIILVCIQKGLRIPSGLHESGESKGAGFNMEVSIGVKMVWHEPKLCDYYCI